MKKKISVLAAVLLAIGLTACGNNQGQAANDTAETIQAESSEEMEATDNTEEEEPQVVTSVAASNTNDEIVENTSSKATDNTEENSGVLVVYCKTGSTSILADEFKRGAEEAGHTCEVIDVCHANIHPCTGCVACGYEGPCVQKDDVEGIRSKLLSSDMVVFATPLYYYGMTAQLKAVVDRFCAYNSSLNSRHLKSALLTVAWNADDWTFEALVSHYKTLVRYINFEDKGMVLGYGCGTPSMTKRSRYPEDAYRLGRNSGDLESTIIKMVLLRKRIC